MALSCCGSGAGADQPYRRRGPGRNRRDHPRRHRPSGNRWNRDERARPFSLTTATDDRGRFVFVVNRSGEWRLTFEAPGFEPTTIPLSVRLDRAAPNLDVKLERRESPEAFGALAGVDSKSLSAQLAAAAALYDEGRYDQAIAAYREIKTRAPALTLVNLQIGNSYLAKKSYAEADAAFQEALKDDEACERPVRDGCAAGSAGERGEVAELVSEGGGRRRGLDEAVDETGLAGTAPRAITRRPTAISLA